jgi:UDP-N-acetylmuramate dehydrogenase
MFLNLCNPVSLLLSFVIFFHPMHKYLEEEPLACYTTLGVGGPARFLTIAKSEDEILRALDFARAHGLPVFILGGGSNIVVSDAGYSGMVLKIEIPGIQPLEDCSRISVGAGVEWDALVHYCVSRNLAGIECLSGIPGTVGAAPIQNIGAYGEEAGDVIFNIRALDRNSNRIVELAGADCRFSYRASIFNTTHQDRYILMQVDFTLRLEGMPRIQYPDLQRRFGNLAPSLGEVREAVLQIREAKAMALNRKDPDSKSVGSFFKNPILAPEETALAEKKARGLGFLGASDNLPRFVAADGKDKVPAAWLIEHAGFNKGYVSGRAGISSKHALALINRGGAQAQDILDLKDRIQTRVLELFGIQLQPEPVFVGFEKLLQDSAALEDA